MTLGCEPAADMATQIEFACERLYRCHQAPLVAFARRRGCDEHEAWDVVQELFLRAFRRGMLVTLSAWTEDAQRSWLLRALRWIICNQLRDRLRLKRGCSHPHESLEHLLDEGWEIGGLVTPATEYDRQWAAAVLERGMARLRADMKPSVWAGFESSLWGTEAPGTPAIRVARHRARGRLRELIRCESSEAALYQAACGQN